MDSKAFIAFAKNVDDAWFCICPAAGKAVGLMQTVFIDVMSKADSLFLNHLQN